MGPRHDQRRLRASRRACEIASSYPRYALKTLANAPDARLPSRTVTKSGGGYRVRRRASLRGEIYLFGAALIAKVCDAFSYHVDVFSDTDRRLARAFFLTAGFLVLRRLVVFALLTRRSPYGSPGVHFPDWLASLFSTAGGEL